MQYEIMINIEGQPHTITMDRANFERFGDGDRIRIRNMTAPPQFPHDVWAVECLNNDKVRLYLNRDNPRDYPMIMPVEELYRIQARSAQLSHARFALDRSFLDFKENPSAVNYLALEQAMLTYQDLTKN